MPNAVTALRGVEKLDVLKSNAAFFFEKNRVLQYQQDQFASGWEGRVVGRAAPRSGGHVSGWTLVFQLFQFPLEPLAFLRNVATTNDIP
ncbi:MAG: hypothetical protein K9M54_00630, partial [Kiritimatiellales bacterium]|nr:hypothetical protein [Kiritimatiellales bacterium]